MLFNVEFEHFQMEERESNKREKHTQEYQDNLAEMYNTLTSDIMTENKEVSKSNLGPNRQIGYLYKGMTAEEKAAFKAAQLAQIEEAKVRLVTFPPINHCKFYF